MKLISSAKVFLVGTAAAFAISGLSGVAVAASAATAAPAHTIHAATAASAHTIHAATAVATQGNKTCPVEVGVFRTYDKQCHLLDHRDCNPGNEGSLKEVPKYASNGCGRRVWLYPARGEQGIGLCLTKRTATNLLTRNYESFRVVTNSDPC